MRTARDKFEIVARVWHQERLTTGRVPNVRMLEVAFYWNVPRGHYELGMHRAKTYVQKKLQEANGGFTGFTPKRYMR